MALVDGGERKDLYMYINSTDLLLMDPTEMTVLHKQSIPSICVWGVGRENSRFIFDRYLSGKGQWMFVSLQRFCLCCQR